MNLTIACERALASPQLALIDAQILDQARDLTLATLDECAAATTEVLSSLLPINSTAGGGMRTCAADTCGADANCSTRAVLEDALIEGAPTSPICFCVWPNRPFTDVSAALSPYLAGCAQPRMAHFIEQTGQATSSIAMQLFRTASGGEAAESPTLRLVMKGNAQSIATWSIDPDTLPSWLSTPLNGTVGAGEASIEWSVTLSSSGLPARPSPYKTSLAVTVASDVVRTITVPIFLFINSDPGLRPCDEGYMFAFGKCEPCLEHATCGIDTLLETVSVNAGHWRLSNRSTQILGCSRAEDESIVACVGGSDAGVLGAGYCAERHSGPVCAACGSGDYFKLEEEQCVACPSAAVDIAAPIALVAAVMLLYLGMRFASTYALRRRLGRTSILSVMTKSNVVPVLKLLFGFIQVVAFVPTVYSVRLPERFQGNSPTHPLFPICRAPFPPYVRN